MHDLSTSGCQTCVSKCVTRATNIRNLPKFLRPQNATAGAHVRQLRRPGSGRNAENWLGVPTVFKPASSTPPLFEARRADAVAPSSVESPRRCCLAAAMKLAAYEAIRSHLLSLPCNVFPDMDALKAQHPGVSLDALVSICSQESARRIKANHGRHVRGIEAHAKRYLAGEDVFDIADQIDFPPCQLMRLLLEHLLSLSHKSVGPCLRDPFGKIPASPPERTPAHAHGPALCARLRSDVERCVAWDHVASPAVDTLRHTAGREYEDLLEHSLTKLGVPFVTEQALRAEGHAKTPDIKLELPIAVKGRVVNWIDSKASFCDPLVHVERGAEQFQGYVNRFGPGMVVYWLGVIDEVADESVGDVLLVDDFPDEADVVKLKLHTHDAREAGSDEA